MVTRRRHSVIYMYIAVVVVVNTETLHLKRQIFSKQSCFFNDFVRNFDVL